MIMLMGVHIYSKIIEYFLRSIRVIGRPRPIKTGTGPSLTCLERHQSKAGRAGPYRLSNGLFRSMLNSNTDTDH